VEGKKGGAARSHSACGHPAAFRPAKGKKAMDIVEWRRDGFVIAPIPPASTAPWPGN
jgi:hypothetical protein